jgi:N-acetylneuraminate synthase
MSEPLQIGRRTIGPGHPVYVVAELSANHHGQLDEALRLVSAARQAGADAVKLQTYTADTLTLDCRQDCFRIGPGTLWAGQYLYDLYREAATPWEWHEPLRDAARELGLDFFSTPFDATAVDFLQRLDVPAYKVASFELVDLPLLERIARCGKPVLLSTGMAEREEIAAAVAALRSAGCRQLALLKCTSAYPAPADEMNLRAIPALAAEFRVPVGLSDHTLEPVSAIAAVALGASIVEKHLTADRRVAGPDSAFSLEPAEFAALVQAIRTAEAALGTGEFVVGPSEARSRQFRRSLFAAADIAAGEVLTDVNVRSIRPADGLPPKDLPQVLGRRARCHIARGTPLAWGLVQ